MLDLCMHDVTCKIEMPPLLLFPLFTLYPSSCTLRPRREAGTPEVGRSEAALAIRTLGKQGKVGAGEWRVPNFVSANDVGVERLKVRWLGGRRFLVEGGI